MITKEQIEKIADLSRLTLSDEEKEKLKSELSQIVGYIEQIDELNFSYDVDGQFINITVPDPTYKQLMEVVDDLNRKKNSAMGRLTKAKSEATSRARTAVENEFITQGVASAASRKCDEYYQNYGDQISEMTLEKIKDILGPEFFEKYKTEELDFA